MKAIARKNTEYTEEYRIGRIYSEDAYRSEDYGIYRN